MREAYRGWSVSRRNGQAVLCSPTQVYTWVSGVNSAGDGRSGRPVEPDEHNSAGFYALKSPDAVYSYFQGKVDVIGVVRLYGTVVEGVRGFRGEKAEVAGILLPTVARLDQRVLDELVMAYRVPLIVTSGRLRHTLETERNRRARLRVIDRWGMTRRCAAGARALVAVRRDGFLL